MKLFFFFSLFLAISCSTDKKEKISHTGTESEATTSSPYTVEPCYCMKIYEPVCAAGVSYGNSCEAECHGNKTWSDGPCDKK